MKFYKIICVILSISLVGFMFSSCSNSTSLRTLTIIQGIGIDKRHNDVQVSMQYLELDKNSGSTDSLQGNITSTVLGTSSSISSAISKAAGVLSKEVFFGQNKIIVFGKDYADENLEKGLDYLIRSIDSRGDVLVAVSNDKASDIICNKKSDAKVPAEELYDMLTLGQESGITTAVCVNDLLNKYAEPTSDIYLPVLEKSDEAVDLSGIAVFSNMKYATTLSEKSVFGFLCVNGKIKNATISVASEKLGNIGVEITSLKVNNKAYVKNSNLVFESDIKVKIMLNEVEKGITTAIKGDEIKMIEELVSRRINNDCTSAVKTCFNKKSDPFFCGKYLAMYDSKTYEKIKYDFREYLSVADVVISVNTNLQKVNDNSVRR